MSRDHRKLKVFAMADDLVVYIYQRLSGRGTVEILFNCNEEL